MKRGSKGLALTAWDVNAGHPVEKRKRDIEDVSDGSLHHGDVKRQRT